MISWGAMALRSQDFTTRRRSGLLPASRLGASRHSSAQLMSTQLPTRQARVSAVALHLAALEPRQTITHEQIRDELGIDMADIRQAGVFREGRRKATREHGCVLKSIRGVGYARMTDEEVADDDSRVRRVRSQAKRGIEELMTVDPSKVSKAGQAKLAAKMIVLSAVSEQTKPSAVKAIKPTTPPNVARALLASSRDDS